MCVCVCNKKRNASEKSIKSALCYYTKPSITFLK